MMYANSNARRPSARARRGASLVETAFVLPVFLLFLFGTITFSQVMYAYNAVAEAARTGARYAIVHGSASGAAVGPAANDTTVEGVVRSNALALDGSRLTVTSSWPDGTNDATSHVTVTASYNCPLWFSSMLAVPPITVTGTTTMQISH